MREIRIEQSVIVHRQPERVFSYVGTVENLVDWAGLVIAVRKASSGCIRTGDVMRMTIRFLGRWLEMTYEVVEYEPYHHITIKSISGISPCMFSWQFESLDDERTRILHEAVINIHNKAWFPGVTEPTLTEMARRQLRHDLLTLKDLLESSIDSEASYSNT